MRQAALQSIKEEFIEELASGRNVQLTIADVTVAEIVPINREAIASRNSNDAQKRAAAFERISAVMDQGVDLGGVWNGRSELYDSD
jgi:antitoxin (DNA-binding transcriptional repressor) of toxin-antitoxin stability system